MKRLLPLALLLAACGSELRIPEPAALAELDAPVRAQYDERRAAVATQPGDAEAWGRLGQWFDAYEQWDNADACYESAWLRSRDLRWLEHQAHAERLAGDSASAILRFRMVSGFAAERAAPKVWLGELQLDDGQTAAARQSFEQALALDPALVRARAGLARVRHAEGAPAEAAELLRPLLDEQPESGVLNHLLGLALRDAGDDAGAREQLGIAAAQGAQLRPIAMDDPIRAEVAALRASARAEGRRAGSALREGRYGDALDKLREALAANPDDATAALNLARAQARLGDPQAAVDTLGPLLSREPRHSRALEIRGLARSLAGDEAAALADFTAAVAADAGNLGARRQLARLLWSRGEKAASLPHWDRVAQAEPGDTQARLRRAEAAAQAGRWTEAIAWLERDFAELPPSSTLTALFARSLATAPAPLRQADRAERIAMTELEARPRLRELETAAIAAAGLGDFEEAARLQREAWNAVVAADKEARHDWVRERLELFESRRPESLPFREGEGRGSLKLSGAPPRDRR